MALFPVTVSLRADQDTRLTNGQVDDNFSGLANAVNALYGPIVTDATTARTLALTDAYKYIRMTSASANAVTVPLNATVAFPIGTEVTIMQAGAGQTSVAATGGVTINAIGLSVSAQYRAVTLKKVATNEWDLIGALS